MIILVGCCKHIGRLMHRSVYGNPAGWAKSVSILYHHQICSMCECTCTYMYACVRLRVVDVVYIHMGLGMCLRACCGHRRIQGGGGSGGPDPPFFSKILGIDFYSGFRRNVQHRLL